MSDPPRDAGPVVPLRAESPPEAVTRPRRAEPIGRLHGLAMVGMTLFAVIGSLATVAFITVGWPGELGHYVVAAILVSVIGFVACASAAVLSAARDTYPRRARPGTDEPQE